MHPIQTALYARVSSEQQAEAHTIASQVAALRERVTTDGLVVPTSMEFLDDGYSGATLVRPALERLRDAAAAGGLDRLYVHSPDRLARKYAYQVLLVEELGRDGVEVVFLNRELGRSPEDDLLLQVQGMMAEYERAKILERHRRGKLHAARVGSVNVLSGAPYGYRYVTKHEGGGHARYDLIPDEACVVRQVFEWIGRERLSIGEVCRRLMQAGERTRTGRTVWERSVVWAMLKNPAYMGSAAFGKTRQGPLRPKLRAQRNRPLQPRRAVSDYDVSPTDWIHLAVPAIVEPEVFAAVQEQLQENRRHARQSQRGARYLLQGLLQCQHCGYAFYGKPLSPSARKGRPRAYAYYRCVGTDAYRFGGHRLCPNTQVRTDRLERAVWQEVCALLAHPERLAQEFTRRLQADGQGQQQERTALERQVAKLRQGLARLIDSYAEGLIEKQEFEPRVTRLRQRMTHVEAQCHQLAEAETLQRELQLIIGRVEEFAAQVHQNLEALEWQRQREILRALVRRVEIGLDQVQVVFRVDAFTGEANPEKKSLQLCKRSSASSPGQHLPPRTGPVYGIHLPASHGQSAQEAASPGPQSFPLRKVRRRLYGVVSWHQSPSARHARGMTPCPRPYGAHALGGKDQDHPYDGRLYLPGVLDRTPQRGHREHGAQGAHTRQRHQALSPSSPRNPRPKYNRKLTQRQDTRAASPHQRLVPLLPDHE
jgi:site-specific DNA recombinase